MQFLSLEPFVPSGSHFDESRQFFQELGFRIRWDAGDMVGFERDDCRFILQRFDNVAFAENFMLSVRISSADDFWQDLTARQLPERFGIRLSPPTDQPYGREVNLTDLAGVCWHFIS